MIASVPAAVDAVVIGAGPNGLVAANRLADAGWEVLLVTPSHRPVRRTWLPEAARMAAP